MYSLVASQVVIFDPPWFATPELLILDSMRLILMLGDLTLIYLLMHAVFLAPTMAARFLLISFVCAVILSFETQVERMGDSPLSWRFFFVLVETVFGLYGGWRYVYRGEAVAYVFRSRRRGRDNL